MKTYILMFFMLVAFGCAHSGGKKNVESSSMDAHEVDLRLNLVESHITSRQPQFALQELLKVESAAKHLSRFHFDSGLVYLQLDELAKAHDGFARSVAIDPDFGEGWNNLGKICEMLKQFGEAEAAYRKALAILTYATPEFPSYNLANLFMNQGRPKDAEEFARKALVRNWRYTPAYKLLADALNAQNRSAEAEAVLRSGLEADMQSMTLALALAEHQMRMNKNVEARVLFERIINQSPNSNEAKVAKDYLEFLQ